MDDARENVSTTRRRIATLGQHPASASRSREKKVERGVKSKGRILAVANVERRGANTIEMGAARFLMDCLANCYSIETPYMRDDVWERYRRFMKVRWGLGEAESHVATFCVRGLRNNGIARRLDVSAETVNKHLDQVYRKAGVRSRSELAAVLLQMAAAGISS